MTDVCAALVRVDWFSLDSSVEGGECHTFTVPVEERHKRRNVRHPSGQRLLHVLVVIQLHALTEVRNVSQ